MPDAGAVAAPAAVLLAGQDAAAAIEAEMDREEEVEETQETEEREPGELGDDEEDEDDDGDSEVSQDLTTHYYQVVDTQSGLDANWLHVLWSYRNNDIQARY